MVKCVVNLDLIWKVETAIRLQVQVTCAMVHPCGQPVFSYEQAEFLPLFQDPSGIERLPEENVSIVETPEREERPETVRAIAQAPARRKLYFNPAYFDLELLLVSVALFT